MFNLDIENFNHDKKINGITINPSASNVFLNKMGFYCLPTGVKKNQLIFNEIYKIYKNMGIDKEIDLLIFCHSAGFNRFLVNDYKKSNLYKIKNKITLIFVSYKNVGKINITKNNWCFFSEIMAVEDNFFENKEKYKDYYWFKNAEFMFFDCFEKNEIYTFIKKWKKINKENNFLNILKDFKYEF